LTRIWAPRGSRPRAPRDRRYAWAYLFGAVCPTRAAAAALVLPHADADAMTLHLQAISHAVTPGAHAVVVADGAGYHHRAAITIPDNITLLTLPPYSPELNPIENVWQFLRQNFLSHRILDDYDAIVTACCDAWNALIAIPERLRSITTRHWAKTVSD
jgi:transposase